ncbi:MAG: DUF3352 domain-containing protein [Chloroflexota bacterium]
MNDVPSQELYSESSAMPPGNGRFRRLLWGSTLIAVVVLAAIALVIWLDPFGWAVVDRLSGRYDAALTAVPEDSILYVGMNLLNGNADDIKALRDTFAAPLADTEVNLDETQQEFNDMLADEFGVTYADDIQPWLGQYFGFALLDVTLDEYGNMDDVAWLLVAETRNGSAADDFLAKVAATWAENHDVAAVNESYNGIAITSFPAEMPGEGLALARSGRMVLAAANVDVIKQAIDTQKGNSLADKAAFQDAVADLPTERVVTMYMDGAQLTGLMEQVNPMAAGLGLSTANALSMSGLKGTAVSLTFVDAGLQIDTVNAYNADELSSAQRTMLDAYTTAPVSLSLFPEDTFLYMGAQGLGNIWELYRETLVTQMGDPEAFSESMALFARDFGINPDTDFLPYLNRELAFGLMPADSGLLADELDLPMGMVLVVGTDNEAALAASIATFTEKITDPNTSGLGQANRVESNGLTLYEFSPSYDEALRLTYGTGRDYFYLGTSTADIQSLQFGGGTALADSDGYQTAVAAFPDEMVPVAYLDLRSLMSTVRSSVATSNTDMTEFEQVAAVLYPLHTIAAAVHINDMNMHQTTIFFIEK